VLQFIITDSVRWKSRTVVELCDESTLCYVKYDDDSCAERRRKSLDLLRNDNESEEQKNCILRQYFVVNTEYTVESSMRNLTVFVSSNSFHK